MQLIGAKTEVEFALSIRTATGLDLDDILTHNKMFDVVAQIEMIQLA